ncbi:MAG: nucleobase:cation symporter-2 family protein, partial [Pseudomonadota bacterium]
MNKSNHFKTFTIALQHVLAMYAGAVAVPLLVGNAIGLDKHQIAFLVQADLFTCGIATILQSFGLGKHIGIKMPVILGVTFAAVGPMITIGQHLGMPYVYGSIIISGLMVLCLSGVFSKLKSFFPSVVIGSILIIIGISLLPVAFQWAAGGSGAKNYGALHHLLVAFGVLGLIIFLIRFTRGLIKTIAILLGIIIGTLVETFMGHASFEQVYQEPWISLVTPFWFGIPRFDLAAILTMCLVAIICMIESTGVFLALGDLTDREVTSKDIAKGLRAEGLAFILGSILNSFPYTTFSQNVGLVAITKVKSCVLTGVAGVILMALGLFPKLAAVISSIPLPVLGGAGIVMFGVVAVAGIEKLSKLDFKQESNQLI